MFQKLYSAFQNVLTESLKIVSARSMSSTRISLESHHE